jgi:uncharacterized protein (TIRG00374 family)
MVAERRGSPVRLLTSRAARTAAGLGGFAAVLVLVDPAETWQILVRSRGAYVALSLALMGVVTVIRAQRWWMISRGIGLRVRFVSLLEITIVSSFFNLFLPGSVGGDAYRAYSAARLSDRRLRAVAGVAIERLTGVAALALVAVTATALTHYLLPVERGILLAACAAIVVALGAALRALGAARSLYMRFGHLLPRFVARRITPDRLEIILTVIEDVVRRRKMFAASIATGVVLQLVVLTTYYTTSLALGNVVPAHFFFVFFPIIELAGMIPLTVNGMGIKEGLVVLFLKLADVAPSFAMGLAILNRLLAVFVALVGGLIWCVRRRRRPELAAPFASQAF